MQTQPREPNEGSHAEQTLWPIRRCSDFNDGSDLSGGLRHLIQPPTRDKYMCILQEADYSLASHDYVRGLGLTGVLEYVVGVAMQLPC